ncbi:helix-turn-helix domain-containing protein [Photobacterium damselae]|uniref:helix-turn-helix domain-containing protein n=1 Tax=Photobacterium damselae TaxID=38293 RepID=UPI00083A9E2A|nr:AraC family transcriptional regulator [Photobacterium damselae]KAB1508865.1 helix-turn-helix transcriptional regulator [Photobacterium damselae subsp. damselae]ODA24133.1 AraC family transcriptional regulator [Photobacterium damselae subsp. damselae]TLS65208.1 helix-turn-helix transcriptional regulator [Photobacterium damselae subsp. damselae]TLS79256.1 helix-turn-helix transcriptional regulator [Photobacterium damselae subsp. damselae]TLS87407.1 helix-turn-helix transcriptional regulator [
MQSCLPTCSKIVALPDEMDHHHHDHHQLVIGVSGRSEFEIEGKGNVISKGQGCIVSSDAEHAFSGLGTNEILVVNLPSHFEGLLADHHQLESLFDHSYYFSLDLQAQTLIQALSTELSSAPNDLLLSQSCSNMLLCSLQRHIQDPHKHVNHRLNMDLLDLYIESHLSTKISVSELAGSAFLSDSQFFLLFKQQVGMTPHQYVLHKRLHRAKHLLIHSQLSLMEISQQCGFASQSSFTQSFSRLFSISPARFRKMA